MAKAANPVGVTDADDDALLALFERSVPHPRAANLVYRPEQEGLGPDPTAEQIVDAALAYRPLVTPPPHREPERP